MSITGFNRRRRADTEPGNTERPEVEKEPTFEPTFNEIRAEARAKGIKGYGKMNKGQLLEALRGD